MPSMIRAVLNWNEKEKHRNYSNYPIYYIITFPVPLGHSLPLVSRFLPFMLYHFAFLRKTAHTEFVGVKSVKITTRKRFLRASRGMFLSI